MGRTVKFLPLLFVIVVGIVAVALYRHLQQVKGALVRSQQDVAQLTTENESLTQQLDDLQAERKNLEERVSSLRTQLSSTTTELERSRVSLKELEDHYELVHQERDQLQGQLASLTSERDDARKQASRLEQDNADLERGVSRLRERLALLDRDYRQVAEKLAQLSAAPNSSLSVVSMTGPMTGLGASSERPTASTIPGSVELPPIIVRKDQAMLSLPIRGRLMEVNESHNFIIMDKGSEDGVRIGMTFDVLRGTGTVGRATVVRVRPHLAAGDIIRAKTPSPLQAGDLAIQSGP